MNTDKLPLTAYATHPTTGAVIMVRRGQQGYWPVTTDVSHELLNAQRGITPQQAAAMLQGSMFGWDCPAADPDKITETDAIVILAPPAQRRVS